MTPPTTVRENASWFFPENTQAAAKNASTHRSMELRHGLIAPLRPKREGGYYEMTQRWKSPTAAWIVAERTAQGAPHVRNDEPKLGANEMPLTHS
jgi:hypothetical protein